MNALSLRFVFGILAGPLLAMFSAAATHAQRDTLEIEVLKSKANEKDENPKVKRIREVLQSRVNLRFQETSLKDFAAALSDEFEIAIRVDERNIAAIGIDPNAQRSFVSNNVTLSSSLNNVLLNSGMGYAIINDELVFTSSMLASSSHSKFKYEITELLPEADRTRVQVVTNGDQIDEPVLVDIKQDLQGLFLQAPWNSGFGIRVFQHENSTYLQVTGNEILHQVVVSYLDKTRAAQKLASSNQDDEKTVDTTNVRRVYLVNRKEGVDPDEFAQLVQTVFAENFDSAKGQDIKAIAGTLVISNTATRHKEIQQFLKDMKLLGSAPVYTPVPAAVSFGGGGMGGGGFGGGMGGGGFAIPAPPSVPLPAIPPAPFGG